MLERENTTIAKCDSVWKKYKILAAMHPIRRTGVKNHGICVSPLYLADQNVLEHSYMVTALAVILYSMFEELRDEFSPYYVQALLFHDIGETKIGDIPDDGTAEAIAKKDAQEFKFLSEFVEDFDYDTAEGILADFGRLQRKGNILYMLDKLEWIFFVGHLTPSGDAGSMNYKETHLGLTEQDKHAIEVTGSYRTVDAMVVHFLEHTRGIKGRDVMVSLIESMYMSIDGLIPAFVGELY